MRNLILSAAAVLAMTGTTTVKASPFSHPGTTINTVQDSTTKSPVKLEELPDAVKNTLKADVYKAWTPVAAYLIKTAQGAEYYQIDVKKEDKTAYVKIDKEGKVVE